MISTLLRTLFSVLGTHRKLAFENLALRQQIIVLRRSVKRPRLQRTDRVFWVLLSRIWRDWANTLTLVKPDTVVRWHRKGFMLYRTWKSRRNSYAGCRRPIPSGEHPGFTASPYVERLIGTLRRDCVDHVVVFNEKHLRRLLRDYLSYYHSCRTHLSFGKVVEIPMVGGLHRRYRRLAA